MVSNRKGVIEVEKSNILNLVETTAENSEARQRLAIIQLLRDSWCLHV